MSDPKNVDAAYLGAEALYDCRQFDLSYRWAYNAWCMGSTLAPALLDQSRFYRRQFLRSRKASMLSVPTTVEYWKAMAAYYADASPTDLLRFLGPSVLAS